MFLHSSYRWTWWTYRLLFWRHYIALHCFFLAFITLSKFGGTDPKIECHCSNFWMWLNRVISSEFLNTWLSSPTLRIMNTFVIMIWSSWSAGQCWFKYRTCPFMILTGFWKEGKRPFWVECENIWSVKKSKKAIFNWKQVSGEKDKQLNDCK